MPSAAVAHDVFSHRITPDSRAYVAALSERQEHVFAAVIQLRTLSANISTASDSDELTLSAAATELLDALRASFVTERVGPFGGKGTNVLVDGPLDSQHLFEADEFDEV